MRNAWLVLQLQDWCKTARTGSLRISLRVVGFPAQFRKAPENEDGTTMRCQKIKLKAAQKQKQIQE
jgi:hypothetical protein